MTYNYNVEFRVRKGLGPLFETKLIPVEYDDVDNDVPESTVKQWAIKDAEDYLTSRDCHVFMFIDIHSA